MFFYRQVLATDARRICFSDFFGLCVSVQGGNPLCKGADLSIANFAANCKTAKGSGRINRIAANNLYACDCKSGVIIFICILADKRGESVNSIVYDIQTNETQGEFPYKLFYCENVITADHCHTETEIISILSGEATVQINGVKYELKKGDIFFAASGDIHSIEYSEHKRLVIQFKLDILKELYIYQDDIDFMFSKLHSSARVSTDWDERTKSDFTDILNALMQAEKNKDTPLYRIRVYSLLYRLADIFASELPEDEEQKRKLWLLSNKKDYAKIEKMFVYIHKNFDKNITLDSMAEQFHYSVNYFTRLWKKYIGTSFHQYLNEYRITQAMAMLRETDKFIVDIAYATGFQSIKSFNRVFKQVTDISPSQYRESYKVKTEG